MTNGFYGDVVQQVRPWSAKAPQLPRSGKTAVEEAGINSTAPARDLEEEEEEEESTKAATDELSDRVVDAEQEREPKTWRNTDQDEWTSQQWDSWAERDFPEPNAAAVVPEPTAVDWRDTDSDMWTSEQWNSHARAVDREDPGL
jgi:hypothetical protein